MDNPVQTRENDENSYFTITRSAAQHQSRKNSGVIHSGIYYPPGSLKAKLCVKGAKKIYRYLAEKGIEHKKIGKLVVAVESNELFRLDKLFERARANKVPGIEMVEELDLPQYQPHVRGLRALFSPTTGIVDWSVVVESFASEFLANNSKIEYNFQVENFKYINSGTSSRIRLRSKKGTEIEAKFIVTAAGLHSDRLASMTGCPPYPKIVPFRGEYFLLSPLKESLFSKTNVYPVPDPRLPFLGVHFTPRLDGSVWIGPNAILATKREGYSPRDFDFKDVFESLTYPGLIKLGLKYFKEGLQEIHKSLSMEAQLKVLRKYFPDLNAEDLVRGPTGVRAQALDLNGNLVEDFVFDSGSGPFQSHCLHVRNAPSPGATSSLAIAEMIAEQVERRLLK